MSQINDLIKKNCPDRVVFRYLGEIANIHSDLGFSKNYQSQLEEAYLLYKFSDMNNLVDRYGNNKAKVTLDTIGIF